MPEKQEQFVVREQQKAHLIKANWGSGRAFLFALARIESNLSVSHVASA